MSIVDRIKEKCTQNGYTVAALERETHIANGTISRWDKSRLSADNLNKVANELHTSMDYLFNGIEIQDSNSLSPDEQEWLLLYKELSSYDPELIQICKEYIKGSAKCYKIGKESSGSK